MKPRWKLLEQSFIEGKAKRECLTLDDSKIYYLTNLETISQPEHVFIGIHGVGGTSLSFTQLISYLPARSQFYWIDLPGFGKSYTRDNRIDVLIECVEQFMIKLGIVQAKFISHSFGAFITVLFAHAHPERVERLVLVTPAGLFPTFGNTGFVYALLFKMRFPFFMRWFRPFVFLMYRIGWKQTYWRSLFYFLSCYCDLKANADSMVSSCITMGWSGTYWNKPVIDKLIALPRPVTLIYGQQDHLIPCHQGWIAKLLRPDIQIRTIRGEGHSWIISRNSKLIMEWSCSDSISNPDRLRHVSQLVQHPERYASSWYSAWNTIYKLYSDLLIEG